jgi:hypothetical protein
MFIDSFFWYSWLIPVAWNYLETKLINFLLITLYFNLNCFILLKLQVWRKHKKVIFEIKYTLVFCFVLKSFKIEFFGWDGFLFSFIKCNDPFFDLALSFFLITLDLNSKNEFQFRRVNRYENINWTLKEVAESKL